MRKHIVMAILLAVLSGGCASTGDGTGATSTHSQEGSSQLTSRRLNCDLYSWITGCEVPWDELTSEELAARLDWGSLFIRWSDVYSYETKKAASLTTGFSWKGPLTGGATLRELVDGTLRFEYAGDLQWMGDFDPWGSPTSLAPLGHAGVEGMVSGHPSYSGQSRFSTRSAEHVGVFANPKALGWEYQSFGAWTKESYFSARVEAVSFGSPTVASSIPVSGYASFSGKLGGMYVSPEGQGASAVASINVGVDFQARELAFTSTNTTLTRDFSTSNPASQLNLHGTLTYDPSVNAFSGTLATSGGTMSGTSNGRFYGPAATELGGVFAMQSTTTPEVFTGAYGAKR
jgi:hypothetical protein